MLIAHASDLHGDVAPLLLADLDPRVPDLWVFSGDILPNATRGVVPVERVYQREWIENTGRWIADIVGKKPMLWVNGNHDFVPFGDMMRSNYGVDARAVTLVPQEVGGLTFSGFPNIRYIIGEWAYETHDPDFAPLIDAIFADEPDVLVTHAPPSGILDTEPGMTRAEMEALGFEYYGIDALNRALQFRRQRIRAHLFGHVHVARGQVEVAGVKFSNAATAVNFVEV